MNMVEHALVKHPRPLVRKSQRVEIAHFLIDVNCNHTPHDAFAKKLPNFALEIASRLVERGDHHHHARDEPGSVEKALLRGGAQ